MSNPSIVAAIESVVANKLGRDNPVAEEIKNRYLAKASALNCDGSTEDRNNFVGIMHELLQELQSIR